MISKVLLGTAAFLLIACAIVIHGLVTMPTDAQVRSLDDIRLLLNRTCAIRQYEDMSAEWERNDNERELCQEFISQIGR